MRMAPFIVRPAALAALLTLAGCVPAPAPDAGSGQPARLRVEVSYAADLHAGPADPDASSWP